MARTPLLNLRVDDETKARWEAAARDAGYTLAEYIRTAVDHLIESETPKAKKVPKPVKKRGGYQPTADGPPPTRPPASQAPRTGARAGMCPHRLRADQFCSRCD